MQSNKQTVDISNESLEDANHFIADHYVLMALGISSLIHNQCKEVPHDIGLQVMKWIYESQLKPEGLQLFKGETVNYFFPQDVKEIRLKSNAKKVATINFIEGDANSIKEAQQQSLLICKAVNNYDKLVEVLQNILKQSVINEKSYFICDETHLIAAKQLLQSLEK